MALEQSVQHPHVSLTRAFRCRKLHSSSSHAPRHHPCYSISFQLGYSCRPMTYNFLQFVLAYHKLTKSLLLQHTATHLLPHPALGVNQDYSMFPQERSLHGSAEKSRYTQIYILFIYNYPYSYRYIDICNCCIIFTSRECIT